MSDRARVRLLARDLVVKLQIPELQAERARDLVELAVSELLAERDRLSRETETV